jgi:hypothetical protein
MLPSRNKIRLREEVGGITIDNVPVNDHLRGEI